MSDVFAHTFGVHLLCREAPALTRRSLLASLQRWCPDIDPLDPDAPEASLLAFVHKDHPSPMADATIAAQTLITETNAPPRAALLASALRQSWDFAQARDAVDRCTASVLVTDIMSSGLDPKDRIDVFQRALRGVLESVACEAIHWLRSERIVDPRHWVECFDNGTPAQRFMAGAVNVRLFNISDRTPGEIVMDTLGLGALGLPDVQCHFVGLEPDAVARKLFNLAWYLLTNGDVIEDGHTIDGIDAGSAWRCQHEDAVADPVREVLDLHPGGVHSAGRAN